MLCYAMLSLLCQSIETLKIVLVTISNYYIHMYKKWEISKYLLMSTFSYYVFAFAFYLYGTYITVNFSQSSLILADCQPLGAENLWIPVQLSPMATKKVDISLWVTYMCMYLFSKTILLLCFILLPRTACHALCCPKTTWLHLPNPQFL